MTVLDEKSNELNAMVEESLEEEDYATPVFVDSNGVICLPFSGGRPATIEEFVLNSRAPGIEFRHGERIDLEEGEYTLDSDLFLVRTEEEINDLKVCWEEDPDWDIEDTPGFEAYKWQLNAFRLQKEAEWKACREQKRKAQLDKVANLGKSRVERIAARFYAASYAGGEDYFLSPQEAIRHAIAFLECLDSGDW